MFQIQEYYRCLRLQKRTVVVLLKVKFEHLPGETEESHGNHVKIVWIQAEIWNRDLHNMSRECRAIDWTFGPCDKQE
jgi:predicted CoA-binding protein